MTEEEQPIPSAALAAVELPPPVHELSRMGLDEWTIRRMWGVIQQRADLADTKGFRRRGVGRRLALAVIVLGAALVAAGTWHWEQSSGLPSPGLSAAGPLLTVEGQRFGALEAPAGGAPARADFADGSRIEALPGARLEGLATTPNEFVVVLRRGRARFTVTPGGARRWLIETRGARVEVVGTALSVESSPSLVTVSVDVGVVLVRSPLLSDGVQRVEAGESLRLALHDDGAPPAAAAAPPAPSLTLQREPRSGAERSSQGMGAAARSGMPTRAARAAELWAEADRARQQGDAARAASLLERLLREYPSDSQAALGAFTLGVLRLEQLSSPQAAARSFEHALELGIAADLRESCYVRLAAALRQTGDASAVRSVAARYLREYPDGRERAAMQQALHGGGQRP